MNDFDKHISSKMNNLKVSPSENLADVIKSSYPKPKPVHLFRQFYGAIITAVVLTGIAIFVLNTIPKETSQLYQPEDYHFTRYSNVENNDFSVNNVLVEKEQQQASVQKQMDRNGNCRHYYSYNLSVEIALSDTYRVQKIDKTLNYSLNGKILNVLAKTQGNYQLILSNRKNQETICLHFLQSPKIFKNRRITVQGLTYEIESFISEGKWLNTAGLNISGSDNGFMVQAKSYGNYQLVRQAKDEFSLFTDTLDIQFVQADDLRLEILSPAVCFGDKVSIHVLGDNLKGIEFGVNAGNVTQVNAHDYIIEPDYDSKIDLKAYVKCQNYSDSIIIPLPNKPNYKLLIKPATCIRKGSVDLVSDDDNYQLVIPESYHMSDDNMSKGKYNVWVSDDRGCKYEHTIKIEYNSDLSARFEYVYTLDGRSIQVIDKSVVSDLYGNNLRYEWYLNGKLVSDAQEPVLDLTEINNQLRLKLIYDNDCFDEYVVDNISPDVELIQCANFFTPNGDGENDVFTMVLDSRLVRFNAKIMTRSGHLIYSWSDMDSAWNGKINASEYASSGVYFYVIQAFDSKGKSYEKKGVIQLIR